MSPILNGFTVKKVVKKYFSKFAAIRSKCAYVCAIATQT